MITLQDYLTIEPGILSFITQRYPYTIERDDLQQELRIKVWQNLDQIENLTNWAITTGLNIAYTVSRMKKAKKRILVDSKPNPYNPIGTRLSRLTEQEKAILLNEINGHIDKLHKKYAYALTLWLAQKKLNGTQKVQVIRATEMLRKRMQA
jgi:DNA-directed RNA polymerase specialized sigma24 family protein